MAGFAELRSVIRDCPVIDNHAHNLLLPSEYANHPFESITSEAQGQALADTFTSLSHLRALNQLKELYEFSGADEEWNWSQLLELRHQWIERDLDGLIRKCLHGTFSILMDDGLGEASSMHPYDWHDQFTQGPTKRIVRIETLAEALMEGIVRRAREEDLAVPQYMADTFLLFSERFELQINQAIDNPHVAGFKSVICYRSGLDIESDYEKCLLKVGVPFEHYISRSVRKKRYRIDSRHVNEFIVLKTLEILSSRAPTHGMAKPLQLHTGLGDNDIILLKSNPAHLQSLIEQYDNVPFVLLHSAYPYTREAGYLASVFKHVYLDVGEVFPMLSRDGQNSVLRQSLELVPFSKLLWSTDGHFFPETYWLANKQFRQALEEVLVLYIGEKDISEKDAISLTQDILFNNSNRLYALGYPQMMAESAVPKILPVRTQSPNIPARKPVYDITLWHEFMEQHADIRFVFVQWVDYMGTTRTRFLPVSEFDKLIANNRRISISQGNSGTLQNDAVTSAANTTGQIWVEPDLRSLRPTWNGPAPAATVFSWWRDEDGHSIKECPRGGLQRLLNEIETEHSIHLLTGFEIEVSFLRRDPSNAEDPYLPLTTNHAWGTLSTEDWTHALPMLCEISDALSRIGINLQQFHSESGPGQYEFILPPLPPIQAIDTLHQARQVIAQVAETHNLRATLHPSSVPGLGTASHVHISLNKLPSNTSNLETQETHFWAGVLRHLESICAFSLSEAESYSRVVEDRWTGGIWVAWGTQNREVPLRKIGQGRWEVRCLDGFANMHLAIGAIVAAGLLGLKEEMELAMRDCPHNPSRLTDAERDEYGICRQLPRDLESALTALEQDSSLKEILAEGVATNYVAMKRAEQDMLGKMGDVERRVWLIERY